MARKAEAAAAVLVKKGAPLPVTYEAAKIALRDCDKIDECKDWADKAAALASYARQAEDKDLLNMAIRIRARAIQRAGELLDDVEPDPGGRPRKETQGPGTRSLSPRAKAAADAGLSEDQAKDALRIASIPSAEFEAAVEAETPASIKKLAKMGTTPRNVVDLGGRSPEAFNRAMHFAATIRRFADALDNLDLAAAVADLDATQRADAISHVNRIKTSLNLMRKELAE